jgi:AGCS family alanine or glycine:cation symporter
MEIDQAINNFFAPISTKALDIVLYAVPIAGQDVRLLLLWLISAALFFTVYFGFINIRYFKHAIDIIRGKYDKPEDDGHINSWQALMTSLSGTVGLGNIAGVAVAVSTGGPGAVFWMIVLGFFSMSTKFTEVTLGVKYRKTFDKDGVHHIAGGPMYYLERAFDQFNLPILGKIVAVFFALCCILGSIGGANIFQANQSFQQLQNITGGETGFWADKGWLFGLILAALVGIVIIGGIKKIATVASRLVPIMAIIYMLAAFIVIGMHAENIIPSITMIFSEAFSLQAGFGGILGAILVGAQRAAFSNESGIGTAAIVYPAARAHEPITQGLASMLGPFIDTIVICTVTALLILISGVYEPGSSMEGIQLTSRAFEQGISWFPYVLALAVFLFAYSTMITFAYISTKAVTYLFGEKKWVIQVYYMIFCLSAVIGASSQLDNVIGFADAVFLSMAIPNILGLFLLAPIVKKDLKNYIAEMKKST